MQCAKVLGWECYGKPVGATEAAITTIRGSGQNLLIIGFCPEGRSYSKKGA